MEQATAGAYYDWADGPSTYINLLSILMGEEARPPHNNYCSPRPSRPE